MADDLTFFAAEVATVYYHLIREKEIGREEIYGVKAVENSPGTRGTLRQISSHSRMLSDEIERTWNPRTNEQQDQRRQYLDKIQVLRGEITAALGTQRNNRMNLTQQEIDRIIELVDEIEGDIYAFPDGVVQENANISRHLQEISNLNRKLKHPTRMER